MNKTVTLRYMPVCECGYIFDRLGVSERIENVKSDTGMLSQVKVTKFEPCKCPKCGRYIKSVELRYPDF